MKTTLFHLEILVTLLLYQIPWPGPTIFKISCPRDSASLVRKLIQKKWIPILKKYQVELPLECPFHESRDIFHPQQSAKHQHRPSQWTCGLCGKSFYAEEYLHAHFDKRHKSDINMAEDAICLADYCDVVRCDVLMTQQFEGSANDDMHSANTDVEVWRETTARQTTVAPLDYQDLSKISESKFHIAGSSPGHAHCDRDRESASDNQFTINRWKRKMIDPNDEDNKTGDICKTHHLVDTTSRAIDRNQQRLSEIQRHKSYCRPEEILKLKIRCEILIRDCIAGLLVNLSLQDFMEVEGEFNRAVCWYLTCDRYWEDTKRHYRPIPWHFIFILMMLLSIGISVCYYIICIIFQ